MKKNDKEIATAVTVGTFDGIHPGHREVLRTLKEYARRHGLHPLVVTFDRHPLEIVAPDRAPRLLQTRADRDRMLRQEGVEVEEVSFTRDICSLTAEDWMRVLRDRYGARAIVTGYDNTFGRDGRNMTTSDYHEAGCRLGLDIVEAPELPGVCSSCIRKAVAAGDVKEASRLLCHDYEVEGIVEEGRRLGRNLGFPTANLHPADRIQLPAPGVYAGRLDGKPAVINIGNNPTVGDGNPITVEAHVLDFAGDLYGKKVRASFTDRLRGEMKFDSLDALKKQIGEDIQEARRILRE